MADAPIAEQTRATQDVARRYFAAWTRRDAETVASLLAEAFRFTFTAAQTVTALGRDAFLSGEAWPEGVETRLLAEAYQGREAFQLYEARNGDATLRVAEHLVVEGERIVHIDFVTDQSAYERFRSAR